MKVASTIVGIPLILEAAWTLVLSAYTSTQDILFGVLQSGRIKDNPDILDIVGPTISTVPRRIRLDNQQDIGALLQACQKHAHEAVPYEVAGLKVTRKVLAKHGGSLNNLLVIQAGMARSLRDGKESAGEDGLAAIGVHRVGTGTESAEAGAYPFGLVLECVVLGPQGDAKGISYDTDLVAWYDDDHISRDMIECLLSHFDNVVNQLVRLPRNTALSNISIWEPKQAIPPLSLMLANPPPAAVEDCVHHLVARHWSPDSPLLDRPAVTMRASRHGHAPSPLTLTYRNLDEYSRNICSLITLQAEFQSALEGQATSKTPFVAICLEKSHWTVAAMIGAWRAGVAIVVLDPGLPPHYLRQAAKRLKAALVLVSSVTQSLWEHESMSTANIDTSTIKRVVMTFPPKKSPPPQETVLRSSTPNDTCYCVFTSGSTSEPKGVLVPHRAICTSAVYHGRETGIGPNSRVLQFASYAFDVAIDEIVTTLIHGGCVCVVDDWDRKSPISLLEAIGEMSVNLALLTPAVLETLDPASTPDCLKTLVVGGSPLNAALLLRWERHVRLLVAYGQCESSVTATINADVSNSPLGTIGRPIGCRAWILGSSPQGLSLLPLGCVGELVIEGPILARGYIGGDPDITSQRFILASSVAGGFLRVTGCHPETQMYRTGDLARQNSDGSLLFLGRVDSQIKVGGVRVEPEAIEHCIVDTTEFRDVIVICPRKGHLSGRLVAVVQSGGGDDDNKASLSRLTPTDGSEPPITLMSHGSSRTAIDLIRQRLPASHIPGAWFNVPQMPLLRSGKINRTLLRKQLEDLEAVPLIQNDSSHLESSIPAREALSVRQHGQSDTGPISSPGDQVKELMGQVLGLDLSSAPNTSTFTRLGGDSLLAMQFVTQARIAGLAGISVAMLLGDTSITELGQAALTTTRSAEQTSPPRMFAKRPLPLKVPEAAEDTKATIEQYRVPLTFAQRLFFAHYPFGPNYFSQSVSFAIDNEHPALGGRAVDRGDVQRCLLQLVERHDALRSRFWRRRSLTPDGSDAWHWESVVTDDVAGSLRFRTHALGKPVDIKEVAIETHQTLNISSGPVFAADLFCLKNGCFELVLIAHHLVVDIVSWSIILGDLEAIILNIELGPAPALPDFDPSLKETAEDLKGTGFAGDDATAHKFWGVSSSATSSRPCCTERFVTQMGQKVSRRLFDAVALIDQLEVGDIVEAVVAEVLTDFCRKRGRGSSPPRIYAEDHGRNFLDQEEGKFSSSRVGWLTSLRSVDIPTLNPENDSLLEAIWRVRNARRRSPSVAQVTMSPTPPLPLEVVINYVGKPLLHSQASSTSKSTTSRSGLLKASSAATAADLAAIPDTDPCLPPLALIEVTAAWRDEEGLELAVTYDARIRHAEMVRSCIDSCVLVLRDQVLPNIEATSAPAWRNSLRMLPGLSDETADYATIQERRKQVMRRLGLASMDGIETIRKCSQVQNQVLLAQAQAQAENRVPTSLLYHIQACWDVFLIPEADYGGLDLARLNKACETVVRHHPVLRTAFVQLPDMMDPIQVVLRDGGANRVLRIAPPSARSQSAASLKLDINHASFDGHSSAVLLRDIGLAYAGKPLHPQSTSVPYRYLLYTEQVLEQRKAANAFWDEYLQDVKPCLLPSLGSSPGTEIDAEADLAIDFFDERLVFEGGKSANLSSWCRQFGATISTAIHVAWAITLSAYQYSDSGTQDVCFGWVTSGRDLPIDGLEDAVGMFSNLLVCRTRIGPDVLLRDSVAVMARDMAKGLQHQLGRPRLHSHGEPLFDTLLSVQSVSATPGGLGDQGQLCFRQREGLDRTKQSLTINIGISKDTNSIDCRVTHYSAKISETIARALFAVFQRALTSIISTPANSDATIADIDLFPPSHLQLAHDMNEASAYELTRPLRHTKEDGTTDEPGTPKIPDTTIVTLFSHQVHARPDAVAVAAWDASLTFSELDTLSTALHKHLVDCCGLVGGRNVALLCDKSAWVVVAMLAVLRAGAACAFLNPADGPRRLRNMVVEQMAAAITIVSPVYEDKAKSLLVGVDTTKILVLDPEWHVFRYPADAPSVPDHCQPDDIALLVFTSGSTGNPKGIRLPHSSLCLSILNYTRRLGISEQTRIFQFSAYTFDVGVGDMLASLIVGAVLCVPSEQDRLSDLNGALEKFRATCLVVTPSVAAFLQPDRLAEGKLDTMALVGELATPDLYKKWHGRIRLFNVYGPAECSVLSTVQEVRSPNDNPAIIGHSLAPHCRVWLVDPTDPSRLVPVGAPGEAMIEGHHVGMGYLNGPEKTANAFLPADKAPRAIMPLLPGARLYLTGDLMRYVPHQGLVFLGRKDLQIKLRGQRIEVGEVEFHVRRRVLESFDRLKPPATTTTTMTMTGSPSDGRGRGGGSRCIDAMVAVILAKQASDQESLVAFISIIRRNGKLLGNEEQDENGCSWIDAELSSLVKSKLSNDMPPYMVPSVFLTVERLPQTPSGKIDRRKLQQIALETKIKGQAYDAPEFPEPGSNQGAQKTQGAKEQQPQTPDNIADSSQQWLRSLWAKVLKVDVSSIGPSSHFFNLGGDSIIAMRLAAASLDEGTCLPVLTIMKYPVLSQMAAALDRGRAADPLDGADKKPESSPASEKKNTEDYSRRAVTTSDVLSFGSPSSDATQNDFPTTSFQESVVTFNMSPERGFLNYFILKFSPQVDVEGLERACRALMTRHPVLRSAFANKAGRLVQRIKPLDTVKIEKLNVGIAGDSARMHTIDEYVAGLIQYDREMPVAWGDCLTKAFIIHDPVRGALSLVIRLSHAVYDGMCLSTLWHDLGTAYENSNFLMGGASEQDDPFFRFVASEASDVSDDAKRFWHSLLRDSNNTPVVCGADDQNAVGLPKSPPSTGLMEGRQSLMVSSCCFSMASVTPASVLKASWAIVLAGNCSTSCRDVVFGHVVSCRETLDPSMYDAVGAFVNCVPVRLVLPGSVITASPPGMGPMIRELAQQAQAQHIAGLPYHTTGLNQLARLELIGWSHPRFASVVQYQNLPKSKALALCGIESGPLLGTTIEVDGRPGAYADVWVTAFPLDGDMTEVEICYDVSVVRDGVAQVLLETLCGLLRSTCV
ncbi:acetyl-CoA synthetase-like protein [Colletotrichum zoysiae]|uniref:Acetyl-CoA synthetase-like protein n=1 Tax=Colletotrichum zoysiae TaxID=1216348 RepID=A0AAD9HAW7_9PEZI|nr:acetyl-CoA synthetase-like protein [Colletotrichum zoysiae]